MAVRTIANGGGDWHTAGTWVEGAVPTSADAVVATATSGNLTLSADGDCLTCDLTSYVGTFTHNAGVKLRLHSTATATVLSFPGPMTYTASPTSEVVIATASANVRTIVVSGKTMGTLTYTVPASTGALVIGSNNTLTTRSFDTINVSGGARTLRIPSSNVLQITDVTNWNVFGAPGALITVETSNVSFVGVLRATPSVYTFTDANGNIFTVVGTGAFRPGELRLDNNGSGRISTPDSVPLSVLSDIDLIARVSMDDWTPSSDRYFISKSTAGYQFFMDSSNRLKLGIDTTTTQASAATGFTDATMHWVRADWRNSDNRLRFHTCNDQDTEPTSGEWAQLGTNVSLNRTGIPNGTSPVEIGGGSGGIAGYLAGVFKRAIVKNGIDGTVVLDADFTLEHPFIACDYVTLQRIQAAGLVDWYADHATDLGSNANWTFGAPPGAVTDYWTVGRLAIID